MTHWDENMDEITGRYYSPKEFIDYKAKVEKPLPMIYKSGYLSIKKYDMEENSFLPDYPNNEVKKGFLSLLSRQKRKQTISTSLHTQANKR